MFLFVDDEPRLAVDFKMIVAAEIFLQNICDTGGDLECSTVSLDFFGLDIQEFPDVRKVKMLHGDGYPIIILDLFPVDLQGQNALARAVIFTEKAFGLGLYNLP